MLFRMYFSSCLWSVIYIQQITDCLLCQVDKNVLMIFCNTFAHLVYFGIYVLNVLRIGTILELHRPSRNSQNVCHIEITKQTLSILELSVCFLSILDILGIFLNGPLESFLDYSHMVPVILGIFSHGGCWQVIDFCCVAL